MERCRGIRQSLRGQPVDEGAVEVFRQIVAQLVGRVDAALHICQCRIGGSRRACLVLDMPKIEVGSMLLRHARQKIRPRFGGGLLFALIRRGNRSWLRAVRRQVPSSSQFVVQIDDRLCQKHAWNSFKRKNLRFAGFRIEPSSFRGQRAGVL